MIVVIILVLIMCVQVPGVIYRKDVHTGMVTFIGTLMGPVDLVLIRMLIIASATKLTLYNIKDNILDFVLLLVDKK